VEPKQKPIEDYTDDEMRDLARYLDALKDKEQIEHVPETDDELHEWILKNLGIYIPRKSVCPGHSAPFDFVSDVFFRRVNSVIVVAGRGSGKTFYAALVQFLICYFSKDALETCSVGAIEEQSKRAYDHLRYFINQKGDKVETTQLSLSRWRSGSENKILTGSKASVNGPHPQITHRDEVELMDEDVYEESLNMTRGKQLANGVYLEGIDIATSTRKYKLGLMQKLLDAVKEAEKAGTKSPYKVYMWCVVETLRPVENCRVTNPDLPEDEKCSCDNVIKDEWEEGKPRTLESVCQGRFAKPDGWLPITELINTTFTKLSKPMWDAQQECKRPYVEDITYHQFSRERHGVKNYLPDPANGPIFLGIDFGFAHPHAALWGQLLDYEIEVQNYAGEPKRIKEGDIILFDELYIAEIGNDQLGDLILMKEEEWRKKFPKFRRFAAFGDPQAAAARADLKQKGIPSIWPVGTRDTDEHRKRLMQRINDNTFFVNLDRVEAFCEEIEVYNHEDSKRKRVDHAVDAGGHYLVSNVEALIRAGMKPQEKPTPKPGVRIKRPNQFGKDAMPSVYKGRDPNRNYFPAQ
jgi:hypothetical protein